MLQHRLISDPATQDSLNLALKLICIYFQFEEALKVFFLLKGTVIEGVEEETDRER